jgi:hypothetical protein
MERHWIDRDEYSQSVSQSTGQCVVQSYKQFAARLKMSRKARVPKAD